MDRAWIRASRPRGFHEESRSAPRRKGRRKGLVRGRFDRNRPLDRNHLRSIASPTNPSRYRGTRNASPLNCLSRETRLRIRVGACNRVSACRASLASIEPTSRTYRAASAPVNPLEQRSYAAADWTGSIRSPALVSFFVSSPVAFSLS